MMVFLPGLTVPASAAPKTSNSNDAKETGKQQGIEKVNQVYEVDQNIVSEFKKVVGNIKASASPARPRKLLVYAASHGPHRFGIPTGTVILQMLGKETGAFTAVVSDDLANFEPDALRQFDAVCFCNATGEVFYRPVDRQQFGGLSKEDQRKQVANAERLVKNLTDYVRNGGGFLGIHAATDALHEAPAYGEMIGGYFDGHPWSAKRTVFVRVEKPEHPLCKNVFEGKGFSIKDEIYQIGDPYSRDKCHVLLSLDLEKSEKPDKPIKDGQTDIPVCWTKPYGKGRVFYSSLGHNKSAYCNPLVLKHWLEGLQYVLGDKSL
jgi:type 1 glutamine amidotransferase